MTIDVKEKQFENHIENYLINHNYVKRISENFDKTRSLDSILFIDFLKKSQPEKWKELFQIHGSDVEEVILNSLEKEIENKNIIDVLRNGFEVSGVILACVFFKPVSTKNIESEKQYQSNILSIVRQVRYTEDSSKSIDLLLCVNGIPVATAEIKNPATGQTFEDAIKQYKEDRDPQEKLFQFKKRAMVHFAIDPYEIHMTTRLNGDKSEFLPFNKGRNEGRGNPDNPTGYRTSYLWEEIWQKDTWLEILENFVDLQIVEDPKHILPSKEFLIFPRYHQWQAVSNLTNSTKENGAGTNYLVQHSTGSGKSNTIAWLSYKLFSLHYDNGNAIYDGIIVISDRVGIVNQLGNTILQFEQTQGVVQEVESSKELADSLETERKILISTQQKFPFVLEKLNKVKGRTFAIIIDEAHSSQTGESAKKVKEVLTTNPDEAAKQEAAIEESEQDLIDRIEEEMRTRGPHENLSYYAFTATPKKKTLRLFGTPLSGDDYVPFHVYSMKQAIEEGFILDVLKNYTTYDRYFRIIKTASQDKIVEGKKASRVLMKYVDTHSLNLQNKAKIIVEHFRSHCQPKIGGLAKAMVVASSRIQALKYKQEIDEYIKSQNYPNIKTLVAFSGSLKDDLGNVYTEQSVNSTSTEWELREKFDTPEFNILVVADKYQTGYDQPLLHTMYVDKKLFGVRAVQTLSRLNRITQGKTETFVVDFQNTVDDIVNSFAPYYKGTVLIDKTDPTYLFKLYDGIMKFQIILDENLHKFAEIFFKPRALQTPGDHGRLYATLDPVLTRFNDAKETDQDLFKANLVKYIEAYSFLTQIIPYDDTNLEKLFAIGKFLANENLLRGIGTQIPELKGDVSLQWYRLEKTHEGDISLGKGEKKLVAGADFGTSKTPEVLTSLSAVIKIINERFGDDSRISPPDTVVIDKWLTNLENDSILREIAQNNDFPEFKREYEKRLESEMLNSLSQDQHLVSRIYTDKDLRIKIVETAAQIYHKWARSDEAIAITPKNDAQNRLNLRQTMQRCRGFIHWIDLYLNVQGLDFLIDNFDRKTVKEIKILTSLHDNEYAIDEKLHERFTNYQEEMKRNGISLEMRVAPTKEVRDRVAHDRFLIGENIKFNIPSFTNIVGKGRYSEIKRTQNEIPFDEYWNDKDSLDIVKDWAKIVQFSTFEGKCSGCNKTTRFQNYLKGRKSLYCKDCFVKFRK